ncbi:MAG TPA: tRNA 2-thiouridine(34) synthase MnmA [Candidatus Deferrimicrobium sp.]|nr:tRNA 2-thiouridine(34) synthase MnmA [Candidatus Deferrimicrobium sp.]
MAKRVLVALSGGVDSSVAALLLKEQGFDVVGSHMKLWDYVDVGGDVHQDGRCCSLDAITDCRMVCDAIGAPFYVLNLSSQFRERVINDFVSEYKAGRTPNPCVRCNADVRWEAFLQKAIEIGCDYIATGHYAFVERNENGRFHVRKGIDGTRDQSYVLWGLTQEALARTLMPLGGLLKPDVREIARRFGLRTAEKPESREICFVADNDYRRFLREWEAKEGRLPDSGDIVFDDGTVVGRHHGTAYFTIGQRKGLGVSHPRPLYVQSIDAERNRVVVGEYDSLLALEFSVRDVNWMAIEAPEEAFEADVKIRYLHTPSPAMVSELPGSTVRVKFSQEQRAITPGQSAVFYRGDVVLGGGIIA